MPKNWAQTEIVLIYRPGVRWDTETTTKVAVVIVAGAAVAMVALMYNATVMEALGMSGEDRPIVQLKRGGVLHAGFEDRDISGIDGMRQAYPSWFFDGSARVRGGDYQLSQVQGRGLFVGVSDPNPADDVWSGMFAMTPNDHASLHHVIITVPPVPEITQRPSNYMNLGMYVQTDTITDRINYVACTVDIRPDSLILRAESGLGNGTVVTSRTVHWEKAVKLDQRVMECTLVTNGDNYFRAIVNGENVFESEALDLQMPKPFNAYLETQVKGLQRVVYGQFTDYYSAFSHDIEVIKLKPGQAVSLGNVTAAAGPDGIARLDVSSLRQPYSGTLVAHGDTADAVLEKNDFAGGDIYSYGQIDWIEKSKYYGTNDKGGTIKS
jgi:hypothetical protein